MAMALISCILSPKLYRIYSRASLESQIYTSNIAEMGGDFALSYLFPFGVMYSVWNRKYQMIFYLSVFLLTSYAVRALGRAWNPTYVTFLRILNRVRVEQNMENMELLRRYDFAFSAWPVGFRATRLSRLGRSEVIEAVAGGSGSGVEGQGGGRRRNKYSPCWILSWGAAHTFGIRLMYPGLLLGYLLRHMLEDSRAKMVTQQRGVRTKIVAADGNYLDTMFFDRRRIPIERPNFVSIMKEANTTVGKILVIACEGNAGFYEIGMSGTPLAEGYSVLGWNHPGFGGSSGTPYPAAELNAAEAVFEYATKELGWGEEDIILYGWSIGGYPATYLAGAHPGVRGLILDATFDDVLPLAMPRMPSFMENLVRATIRYHINLRVSAEMANYKGPTRLIRRTDDEIIADPPCSLSGNRGNYLLMDMFRQRYPQLMDNEETERALRGWLNEAHVKEPADRAASDRMIVAIPANPETLSSLEKATLILKLADKTLTDFKSSHCSPLPGDKFILPWNGSR